jgi:hypothetical protein
MWLLTSTKDRILGVDTPEQQVPPRVWYETACLLLRNTIGCVSCLDEWGMTWLFRLGSTWCRVIIGLVGKRVVIGLVSSVHDTESRHGLHTVLTSIRLRDIVTNQGRAQILLSPTIFWRAIKQLSSRQLNQIGGIAWSDDNSVSKIPTSDEAISCTQHKLS